MNKRKVIAKGRVRTRPTGMMERGVTVVELLVVLSVLAILLAVGIPGFSSVLHKNRISTTSSLLHASLNTARGEALKRRRSVRVCPTADGSSCRNDGDWSEGWLIYEDGNANGSPDFSEIIRLENSLAGGVEIRVTEAIADFLQFQPTGTAIGNSGINGEFRICHQDSNVYSQVLGVSAAGQVRMKQRTFTDCNAPG